MISIFVLYRSLLSSLILLLNFCVSDSSYNPYAEFYDPLQQYAGMVLNDEYAVTSNHRKISIIGTMKNDSTHLIYNVMYRIIFKSSTDGSFKTESMSFIIIEDVNSGDLIRRYKNYFDTSDIKNEIWRMNWNNADDNGSHFKLPEIIPVKVISNNKFDKIQIKFKPGIRLEVPEFSHDIYYFVLSDTTSTSFGCESGYVWKGADTNHTKEFTGKILLATKDGRYKQILNCKSTNSLENISGLTQSWRFYLIPRLNRIICIEGEKYSVNPEYFFQDTDFKNHPYSEMEVLRERIRIINFN